MHRKKENKKKPWLQRLSQRCQLQERPPKRNAVVTVNKNNNNANNKRNQNGEQQTSHTLNLIRRWDYSNIINHNHTNIPSLSVSHKTNWKRQQVLEHTVEEEEENKQQKHIKHKWE